MLKNWRALGPWFQRRLRTVWTKWGVQLVRVWRFRVIVSELSVLRINLAMAVGSGCGGGAVAEWWREDRFG